MKKIIIASALKPFIEKERSILQRADFRIFTATSGEEALKIHRGEKADMIIADLDMPGIGGDKLCSVIRGDEALKKVSIIIVCTNSQADIERCSNSGANSYITKPIAPAQLIETVSRLLNIPERKSYRVLIKVEVKGKFMNVPFFCSSGDLSASGMLVETDKPLAKGDTVSCSFFLPNSERVVADGEIVRVVRKALRTFQYGVRFVALLPEYRAAIETFINNWTRNA